MAMSSLGIPLIPATVMTPGISSSATSGQSVMLPGGMYLGDGVMPLPQRLVKKILELQFIEMFELQPEAWLMESLEEDCTAKCCSASTRRRRAPVTNIFTWLHCYSALVGALSTRFPQKVPEFMAYQSTIVRSYREFDGDGWYQYDRVFRRQVAITKDLHWSRVNTSLYSLCFAGKVRRATVCRHCWSASHTSGECPEASLQPLQQLQSALLQLQPPMQHLQPSTQHRQATSNTSSGSGDLCRLFNSKEGNKCHYKRCKFAHRCNGAHPRSACDQPGGRTEDSFAKRARLG